MDEYIALRDCYFNGLDLKRGQTFNVAKGTVITFKLVKKVETEETKESTSLKQTKKKS